MDFGLSISTGLLLLLLKNVMSKCLDQKIKHRNWFHEFLISGVPGTKATAAEVKL